ncbi:MAG: DUF1905 domain-containing protein [bacterium]
MLQPPSYTIKSKVWLWTGKGAWHFVTVDKVTSEEITKMFGYLSAGWGSIAAKLTIGQTTWKTSLFLDKKQSGYLIPLKAEVRKKESISEGDVVEIKIDVLT